MSAISDMHARYVLTPWAMQSAVKGPVAVRAQGVYIYDSDDKPYLDLSSGLIAVNLGHGHPKVVRAIQEQAAKLCYAPPSAFLNEARAQLAHDLVKLIGWDEGGRVFFTTGGGDANEDAIKIARMTTGRFKVLTGYRSFHGSPLGASSLTGENRRWSTEPGLPGAIHFFAPYPYRSPFHTDDPKEEVERAIDHLELVLLHEDPQRVAAIMLEPVVGTNGVIVYPPGYLQRVRELCDRHGILFILDEVMTGFGRTGAAFAGQRFGVVPDIVTFAKGVTSAYVPLGGCAVRESLAKYFDDHVLWCGHTYSGHPLAMAAGVATLQAYREEGIFERVSNIEVWLREGMNALAKKYPFIGDVRGVGAFFAFELVKDRKTREPLVTWHGPGIGVMKDFFAALSKNGTYALGRYNIVHISPPLVITRDELAGGFQALDAAFGSLAKVI